MPCSTGFVLFQNGNTVVLSFVFTMMFYIFFTESVHIHNNNFYQ